MKDVLSLARPDLVALHAYESARSLATLRTDAVFLDANESAEGPSIGRALNRYPEPQPRALVERLSTIYAVPSERLVVLRGSDEAIDLIVRGFCAAGKDSLLVCPPTYGMYEVSARIQDAAVVRVPLLRSDGTFTLDEQAVGRALDAVKVVFLCSPNNPTGTAFDPRALVRICEQATSRALVVVDEAYAEYSDRASMTASLDRFPHLVVLRTMSKAWAMAGARCGVALGSPEVIALLQKVRAPYPLSAPAVDAVLAATSPEAESALEARVGRVRRERERVAAELKELGAEVYPSAANFLLARFTDAPRIVATARDRGIIVRDRSADVSGGVRVTVGTETENDAFLSAVRDAQCGQSRG